MSQPILTITLNPAIDQTVLLPTLHTGQVNLASQTRQDAGGKGINVAACLADQGIEVVASGLLGAHNEPIFRELFESKGIIDRFVRLPGNTRTNLKLVDESTRETTDINLPGFTVDESVIDTLFERVSELAVRGSQIALCGSLPVGLPPRYWSALVAELRNKECEVLLDTSGAALSHALNASSTALPHIIKPNRHELEEWAGRALPDRDALLAAAHDLNQAGIDWVVVSLGAEGALFVQQGNALLASLPAPSVISTVGAGDALVSGLLAARHRGLDLEHTARHAVAVAVGKLANVGPHLPAQETLQALSRQVVISAP